jgi:sec-independent protein translocase protein TatB
MFDMGLHRADDHRVVALIVIGPERLPRVARTVGHLAGRLQRYVSDVKADINREIELDELRKMRDSMQRRRARSSPLPAELARPSPSSMRPPPIGGEGFDRRQKRGAIEVQQSRSPAEEEKQPGVSDAGNLHFAPGRAAPAPGARAGACWCLHRALHWPGSGRSTTCSPRRS